jgi:integrase
MQRLPNNCRVGKFSVFPSNWKTAAADPKLTWRIVYWFYDDNLNQKKQVPIKGMNHLETVKEKQEIVKIAMEAELEDLQNGYNPITGQFADDFESDCEIDEHTGLLDALDFALKNAVLETNTRVDVTNTLKFLIISIKDLRYDRQPVGQIMPKHIKRILDGCKKIKTYTTKKGEVKKKAWGPYQFNRNRTYLSLLFKVLTKNFIIQFNPVREIEKEPVLKKIRETTTIDQRKQLKAFTHQELYTFYRFIEIYFHSARRVTELLAIKKEDVQLDNQRFKVVMKKGKKFEEIWVTIKTIALPFWVEIYNEAEAGEYLFGEGLKPQLREKPIRGEQISRRWRRHIKKKLGVTADFASLKHSNLDEISAILGQSGTRVGIQEAQKAAGHSTPVITMRYLPGQEERNHNELKDLVNEL